MRRESSTTTAPLSAAAGLGVLSNALNLTHDTNAATGRAGTSRSHSPARPACYMEQGARPRQLALDPVAAVWRRRLAPVPLSTPTAAFLPPDTRV